MATDKPRLTITLDPRVYSALKGFSDGSGTPMSQFISEMLLQQLPILERMALMIQAAKRAKPEALREIHERTTKLFGVAEFVNHQMQEGVDLFWSLPDEELSARTEEHGKATKGQKRGPKGPPSPNRGGQKTEPNKINDLEKAVFDGISRGKVTRIRDHRGGKNAR